MTREEFIEQLSFLDYNEIPNIEIFVLAQPAPTNDVVDCDIYKTRIHERIPDAIKDIYFPKIKKSLIEKDYDLTEYNPALSPDRNVIWNYETNVVPFYNFINRKLQDVENYYNKNILDYDDIWAIWIKFQIQNKCFYLLKK